MKSILISVFTFAGAHLLLNQWSFFHVIVFTVLGFQVSLVLISSVLLAWMAFSSVK